MKVLKGSGGWWKFESFGLGRRQRALDDEHTPGCVKNTTEDGSSMPNGLDEKFRVASKR
jgi:hypothetical protein